MQPFASDKLRNKVWTYRNLFVIQEAL